MKDFNVIIEKGEDGFFISEVIEIPRCHTQGKTIDELMERTKEAIELCLEDQEDDEVNLKFVGLQKIEIENEQTTSN